MLLFGVPEEGFEAEKLFLEVQLLVLQGLKAVREAKQRLVEEARVLLLHRIGELPAQALLRSQDLAPQVLEAALVHELLVEQAQDPRDLSHLLVQSLEVGGGDLVLGGHDSSLKNPI